jgi:hypothetical protein
MDKNSLKAAQSWWLIPVIQLFGRLGLGGSQFKASPGKK